MSNSSKLTAYRRVKKKLRSLAFRHPYIAFPLTFIVGKLLDTAAEHYLSGLWEWLGALISSMF